MHLLSYDSVIVAGTLKRSLSGPTSFVAEPELPGAATFKMEPEPIFFVGRS